MRVLLHDDSGMIRQTLGAAMHRWGVHVVTVTNAADLVEALDKGMPASAGCVGGLFSVVLAEKNVGFVKAVRAWASKHGKLTSGARGTNGEKGKAERKRRGSADGGGTGSGAGGGEGGGEGRGLHSSTFQLNLSRS